ncbi:MAG: flagellar hook basal-body protein [Myxococcota bacterium]
MADGIYVSMSGAAARAAQLEAVADNLANSETTGYLAARPAFESFLPEQGAGQLGYTAVVGGGVDLRPGATMVTGLPTDVLPDGGAFLAVAGDDGGMAFTRNGRLVADGAGRVSVLGRTVLGIDGQPLIIPSGSPWSVDGQGTVLANGQEVGRLALFQLSGEVERRGEALYAPGARGQATAVEATVRTGELMLSNANPLESAVQMISAQRNFDTSMQAVQTYRRLDERANELGRVR